MLTLIIIKIFLFKIILDANLIDIERKEYDRSKDLKIRLNFFLKKKIEKIANSLRNKDIKPYVGEN